MFQGQTTTDGQGLQSSTSFAANSAADCTSASFWWSASLKPPDRGNTVSNTVGSACLSNSHMLAGVSATRLRNTGCSPPAHEAPGLVRHSPSRPLVITTRLLNTSITTSAFFCIRCVEGKAIRGSWWHRLAGRGTKKARRGLVERIKCARAFQARRAAVTKHKHAVRCHITCFITDAMCSNTPPVTRGRSLEKTTLAFMDNICLSCEVFPDLEAR